YHGPDSFSYTVSDGALTAAATVNLTVQPVNDGPVAVDDAFTVAEDSVENVLDVLANDSDVDGDVLAVASVGSAGHGTVTLTGGAVYYTPAPDYSGTDSFSYTVSDGALTATATVSLTIVGKGKPRLAFTLVAERSGANSDGVVTVGQPITLVATLTNTGQTALRLIPLYMSFDPAVVRLVSSDPAPDQSDANRLIWHDVTGPAWLPAGQKLTIRLVMQATGSSQTLPGRVMVMHGSIEGATDEYDQVLGQNAASSPVRVTAPGLSLLSAIVEPANGIIDAGELVTVTVQIRASGDTTITHLPLQDLYDDKALTFLGASVGGHTVGGGAVTWNNLAAQAGNIAPGQTVAVDLVYRLEQPVVSVTRQAKVEGARDEHGDALPAATAATTFYRPALELSMTAQPANGTRVEAGGTIRYDLVLQNTGGASLSNITVGALLTGDGVFATVETPGTSTPVPCPVAPGQPNDNYHRTYQLAQLAPGASCTVHLKVQAATNLVSGVVRLQVEANATLLRRPAAVEALHTVGRSGPGIVEFTAAATAEGIRLVWKTAEENGVTGFHLWRGERSNRKEAKRITAVPIVPKGKAGSSYALVEFPLLYDHSYFYWLEVIRTDGSAEVGPVSAKIASSMRGYIALVLAEANLTKP
ncbi:MAG: tandem-95 repeat protein, partial [Caldilineaceae bacterium]|nr:tandem-95 repeat protein [Caldilineaceae bacterium]